MINVVGSVDEPAQRAGLSEERVELPELLLLPLIERMIVTLCALNLLAEERSATRCSSPDTPFSSLTLSTKKLTAPLKFAVPGFVDPSPR